MGAVGGSVWHGVKGYRTGPKVCKPVLLPWLKLKLSSRLML
jgi:hypothetical protein